MINSSDKWKHIMLTLPDNYFFELMKNYLGKIETPFNKHDLIEKLVVFLIKYNAEEKILKSLSEKEILFITSINFIYKPTAKSIYEFFSGVIPFIELCDNLKVLEEKLIIYSDNGHIYLSPLFEESIKRDILNPGLLYKSEPHTPGAGKMIWLTDSLILSFLSFIIHQKDLLKSSGAFKKRAYNQIETLYPHLFNGEDGKVKLELVRKILHNLRLFRINDNTLVPRTEIWDQLSNLNREERWLYFASAGTTESYHNLGERISTIKRVIETIPTTRSFYPENLKKLIKAVSNDPSLNGNSIIMEFIDDLLTLNILITLEDGTITRNPILDLSNINPDYGDNQTVIIQPNFDVTFKPWIDLKDGYIIALFSNLKKMDIYTELEINKESVIKGLTLSNLDSFITSINNLSFQEISHNIILTLKEWEKESTKAIHYQASVLILDSDKEYILKETGIIDNLILLNPAKGVYLIKPEDFKTARNLLESVDIIPVDMSQSEPTELTTLPSFISRKPLIIEWKEREISPKTENKKSLLQEVEKISLTKEEYEDLKKRVERGIIFTKEQITKGISKIDFSEAKGINYQAKLRLIEVSIKTPNNRLEINFVEDFEIKKELILPEKIEKQGDLRILHGIKLPQEVAYSIDISKISLVKRIHTTLF
ncbi:MAG: hypothetical protein JXR64_04345 [Spirochaetales bacterium]|nr:hypothetical protein [Spirochaetales bacterium]